MQEGAKDERHTAYFVSVDRIILQSHVRWGLDSVYVCMCACSCSCPYVQTV